MWPWCTQHNDANSPYSCVITTWCTTDACVGLGRNTNVLLYKHVEHLLSYLLIVRVRYMLQKQEFILVVLV